VIEKMMAMKPQDRYPSALEASEALQAVIRPRSRSQGAGRAPSAQQDGTGAAKDHAANNSTSAPASSPAPGLSSPPVPSAVPQSLAGSAALEVPAWFAPLARAAERRPAVLLACLIAVLLAMFGAGFGLGYLLR
jgi:serine/threonine-protein kinase